MEFFGIADAPIDTARLHKDVTIGNAGKLCASITEILHDHGSSGEIYCVWGQFAVNREIIGRGVRFSLPDCPNALAWTVTTENGKVVIHCTINKPEHEPDFIESIRQFVQDWVTGIASFAAA